MNTGVAETLLDWYDLHARDLPWRIGPRERHAGARPDPYRVWLSEIMLQQTTVAAVKDYFERFIKRWPTLGDLADAPLEEVLKEWAGLGYYARARNLHRCAVTLVAEHSGRFPETEDALRGLPGIGPYTSAAIAAIAFDEPATVMDGNVERVVSRLHAITEPLPKAKKTLFAAAGRLTPCKRTGDYAQAMMDLGATICTPRSPACGICPLRSWCAAHEAGIAETLPRKAPKKAKPTRYGVAFVAVREDGAVLLARRPERGLLGGMMEPPGSDWIEGEIPANPDPPVEAEWRDAGEARHTFTHFHLRLAVCRGDAVQDAQPKRGHWLPRDEALSEALPTVMRKALSLGLSSQHKARPKQTDRSLAQPRVVSTDRN